MLYKMKNNELTAAQMDEIQNTMQPENFLHHIKFDADKAEILEPQNELLAT